MDTKSSTVISNEELVHQEDELQSEKTGQQNNQEIADISNLNNTPVPDIEAPLSPVLTNNKKSLKYIARRKSRIKLLNKFTQNSETSQESFTSAFTPLQLETQTPVEDTEQLSAIRSLVLSTETSVKEKQGTEEIKSKDEHRELEERMKRCLEMQRNRKFCYNIANSSVELPENKIIEISGTEIPKIVNNESFVSNVNIAGRKNDPDFNFKKPESPVSQTKIKKSNKKASTEIISPKLELDINLKVGFETGSGKKINLSERALKRAAKIFDDILDIPTESQNVSNSYKNNFEEKLETSLNKNMSTGFKTGSGNDLKLSESSLKKAQTLFDDIFDLSNYNEVNTKESSSSTNTDAELSNSFNQDAQNIFNNSFQTQNNINSPNNTHKTQFKVPTQVVEKTNKEEISSDKKYSFSQITDTQMCLAAENAECLVEFIDSQWTPSPKNKSPLIRKTQLSAGKNLNKSQEDFEELSPEAEQLFGNLTVREDGTLSNRSDIHENMNINQSENLSSFELFAASPLEVAKSEETIEETRNVTEENLAKNIDSISSVGFGTAFGKKLIISEASLKKAQEVFQDYDVMEENLHKNVETPKNISSFGFASASGRKISISEESLKKAKNIFEDCDVTEDILHKNIGFATASGKKLIISEKSLKKAQMMFQDCDITEDNISEQSENISIEFSPAFDKTISVSKKSPTIVTLKDVTFEEVVESKELDVNVKNISNDCNIEENVGTINNLPGYGFVTASGKNVAVSEESLFSDCDLVENVVDVNIKKQADSDTNELVNENKNIIVVESSLEKDTQSSEQELVKSSEEQSTNSEELFFTAAKQDANSSDCCGFNWDEALKSLKINELYKRSFKYIEKDIKNNFFHPLSFIFNDIQSSKEYKNKNYKYFLRSRKRSNTIHSNKKSTGTSRKSTNKAPQVSELLNTSTITTRSRRSLVQDDFTSFAILDSLPQTRNKKRVSHVVNNKVSSPSDVKPAKDATEITNKVKSDIKKTIKSLEDAFLSSVENSFNSTDNFVTCSSNNSGEENISSASFQKNEIESNQCRNRTHIAGKNIFDESFNLLEEKSTKNVVSKTEDNKENMNIFNTPKSDTRSDLATSSYEITEAKDLTKDTKIFRGCDTIKDKEISHENMKTPINISSFGFATASGKKLTISEESLKKAKNIFDDCDVPEEILPKNIETPKNIFSFGFDKASGKKIAISEESVKKAINIFEDCDVPEEILPKNVETPKNISSLGFATASGKKVAISEESLKKAKNIFEDCDITEEILHKNVETPKNISLFGFASASGKKISISEEALKKAKSVFKDCDVTEDILHTNVETPKNISSFGFASASGKKIAISEESLKKAKNIFEDCDVTEDILHKNVETPKNISSLGFATASGKKVVISEESLKKAKNIFEDCDVTEEILHKNVDTPENISSFGFASASGKKISISEECLKKIKSIFENCDVTEDILHEKNLNKSQEDFGELSPEAEQLFGNLTVREDGTLANRSDIHENINLDQSEILSSFELSAASQLEVAKSEETRNVTEENLAKNNDSISSVGFGTAFGKKLIISEASLKKAQEVFQDYDVMEENLHKNVETPKNISSLGFATASGKKVAISEESLKKAKNIFEDCDVTEDILHKNVETPKNISLFGFATASGNKVAISEESLKKAKNIFEDCDVTDDILHKNVDTPKNISSLGFASASGKKISISEESLKKAKNIFEDCDVTEDILHTNVETPKNISSLGFATASGKKVVISEESLKKAKNIFEDCDVTEDILHTNVETPKNISSLGFASASGKKISISEESLKKAKNIFEDCDVTEDILHTNVETPKNISSFGFASASGKKISISEESLKKAKGIFEDCDVTEDMLHKNIETPKNISTFGFATASGKKVAISEESLKKANNLFKDCDFSEESKSCEIPKNSSSFGSATASGKKVPISDEALNKAKYMFEDNLDVEQSSEDTIYTSDESHLTVSMNTGFSTASGNKVNISEEALNKIKNIFDDVENIDAEKSSKRVRNISESCENNLNTLNTPNNKLKQQQKIDSNPVSVTKVQNANSSPALTSNKLYSSPNISANTTPILRNRNMSARTSKKRSLGVSSCRQIDIAENNLKRAKLIFDDDTPKKKEVIINNNNLVNYSPLANKTNIPVINTPQNAASKTPVCTPNKSLLNSSMSMKETNQLRCSQNLSTPKISPKKLYEGNDTMLENSSFIFREKTTGDTKKWNADLQKELEMLKLKMSVIETRMIMLNKQREIIESGSSEHRRQRPGTLFSLKSSSDNRLPLQKAVRNRRPERNTHKICLNMGLDSSVLNITAENSSSLHFHVPWWPNDNRTYPAVIRTEDGAVIVPDKQNHVGISEIEQAFLAMPGVDPSLVPKNWVANHYRWIVWKLASLERNYPDVFKSCLGVENVMNQLKYRYDREIDRAQRPALRKIVECDDTAAKRMVLCVAGILKLENKYELELTDGWYSIKTTLDAPLNSLVERNVIKVGMKLMTQGAELLNCEGCCPLKLPANVRLQIHYNSTRRAAWHLKLGYQPNPGPLRIALRMVSGNGGPVGGVRAYVARVYPISFMERSDAAITWRNQRAEIRRANQWEAAYANTMENLQMKLQLELEKEWGEGGKKNKNQKLKIKDVRGVHCGRTLYQFMEESNDPDSVKELLTPAQISALQNYQSELNIERQAELSSRLREKLSNEKLQPRSVSTVLKLLLVDVQSSYHHRMLSVWRPTESHTQLLKEGIVVNIYNVTAKNNGTLSSIPRTQFDEDLNFDTTKFENLNRFVLPISQTSNSELKPFFGEIDTVGMVVYIDIQQTAQTMWIADENYRFLLIKIREGPETCVMFDGLTPGKVIAVMNLIHQKPFKSYGEAVGNHYTVLSSYPQQTYLQDFMKDFIDSLPQDVDRYLQECKTLVEELSSQHLKRGYILNPLNVNNSEEANETLSKKLCGVENTQLNKSESLTLSDEEMALIDTQVF